MLAILLLLSIHPNVLVHSVGTSAVAILCIMLSKMPCITISKTTQDICWTLHACCEVQDWPDLQSEVSFLPTLSGKAQLAAQKLPVANLPKQHCQFVFPSGWWLTGHRSENEAWAGVLALQRGSMSYAGGGGVGLGPWYTAACPWLSWEILHAGEYSKGFIPCTGGFSCN